MDLCHGDAKEKEEDRETKKIETRSGKAEDEGEGSCTSAGFL